MAIKLRLVKELFKILAHIVLGVATIIAAIVAVKALIVPPILKAVVLNSEQVHNLDGFANIILTGLFYTVFVRIYEKRQAQELAFYGRAMIYSGLAGFLAIALPTVSLFAAGYYEIVTYQGVDNLFFVIFGIGAIAIGEEFLFRGVLFRVLEQHAGTLYALMVVSLLVGAANAASSDSMQFWVLISTALTSALWCGIYVWSRNIWVVGLHHLGWNYAEFLSGILDEHWRVSAPAISRAEGPALLTGGTLGPEASILTLVLCLGSLIFVFRQIQKKPASQTAKITGRAIWNSAI